MADKLKVLQIAFNDLGNGGVQNQIMAIARLTNDKVHNDILVWKSAPAYHDEEFKQYGNIIKTPHYEGKSYLKGKLDFFTRYFRVKKAVYKVLMENGPYDAVHSHKLFESAACLAAAHKAGIPIRVAHAHITEDKAHRMTPARFMIKCYNNHYRKIIRKHATHMIGCSQDAVDYVFGQGYGKPLYIGIDLDKFDFSNYEVNENSSVTLINIGTFSLHKNQVFLIEVLYRLKQLRDDVKLVLIGKETEYKKTVEKEISLYGLEDSVVFRPHDSDIPYEMSQANLFVFPSNFEGFGIVLIEAQAIGLKCFASTRVPKETDCGLVTYLDLDDGAQKWADEINRYINTYGLSKQPQNVERFSQKRMAQEVFDIYSGKA